MCIDIQLIFAVKFVVSTIHSVMVGEGMLVGEARIVRKVAAGCD
jgi:hypothetical protein